MKKWIKKLKVKLKNNERKQINEWIDIDRSLNKQIGKITNKGINK